MNPAQSYTLNERKETYNDAISSIVKHPVIGVGYLNFSAHTANSGDLTIHNTFLAFIVLFWYISAGLLFMQCCCLYYRLLY